MHVTLVVSIDTEGDAWSPTRTGYGCRNVLQLRRARALFERLGVRCTYLPTWQVANDPAASGLLAELHQSGEAEVGAHLHPWDNPPMDEAFEPRNTMLCNLPGELQTEKLRRLTGALAAVRGGEAPTTFRAGRWGLGRATLEALGACGYTVDSSVTPYTSWAQYEGPDFGGAPLVPYRVGHRHAPSVPDPEGALRELPMSAGYTRRPFPTWHDIHRTMGRVRGARGLAHRAGLVRHVVCSPESATREDMTALARQLLAQRVPHAQLMLHSQSLTPGLSPFTRSARDVERLYARIEGFVTDLAALAEVRFATIGEAATRLVA